jgi:hypothetical protein
MGTTMPDLTAVRADDLHALMARIGALAWDPEADPEFAEVWERLSTAKDAPGEEAGPAAEPEPPLPDGEYARVEILGHDSHTGWVTESTRAGQPVMVVRNWDGLVVAEVPGHSLYRFVPLATPLKRPEPQTALPVGAGFGYEYDEMPDDSRDF